MKEEKSKKEKTQWDKKKIILFSLLAFILFFAGFEIKDLVLGQNYHQNSQVVEKNVKGTPVLESPTQGFRNSIQTNIDNLKKEASEVNISDIASSSPQVQKIIKDLKSLQNYPSNKLKDVCSNICNRL